MKVNIIQFDPVVGGETTLTNALVAILKKEHEVRIIHPVHTGKSGKLKINKAWGKVEGEEFLTYSQTAEACENVDFIFCVNAKHVKGSVKSDKREIAQADSDLFFGQFSGKNFIFYEHGFHTWRLYNYENLFEKLMKKGNTIRVLTNTKMAIDFYKTKNYNAYLCRQPFNTDLYSPINRDQESTINFTNHSGGALGSDTVWDKIGREFGVNNHRHYYAGNITPNGNTEVTIEDYEEGRYESARAAKRNFGYEYATMKDGRLIRNWSQVKYAESVFAIGKIVQAGESLFPKQLNDTRRALEQSVTGGTGYAVGMAKNHKKPIFVFDQDRNSWFSWNYSSENFDPCEVPVLTRNFAGIGTREIRDNGISAIREVYRKTIENRLSEEKKPVKICFNSRYSSTKGPHVILKEFMPFFDKNLNFNLQFRGNISDPVSVWHNIDGVLLKDVVRSKKEIKFLDFAEEIPDIYHGQDYCVYAGYLTREERGKIEYAILEPIFYEIPLIVHSDVFEYFKYEEYGITEDELRKCFIELTPENLQAIIDRKFDASEYVKNSKKILKDFLPEKILERFQICSSSPASKGRKKVELF